MKSTLESDHHYGECIEKMVLFLKGDLRMNFFRRELGESTFHLMIEDFLHESSSSLPFDHFVNLL